jgi:DNA-directed RNA polymerase subunit RPC12/RpoP
VSFVQRLVARLMPHRAAEIERESREWVVVCPSCGDARSYWDLGGVRYKAASEGKRMRIACPACGHRGMAPVERRRTPPGEFPA